MIRQATANCLITRDSVPAALVVHGRPCAEHERGMAPFAAVMDFSVPAGRAVYGLKRRIPANAWFRPRASLISPVAGSKVLCLGRYARAKTSEQVRAIVESPAGYEIAIGQIGGAWTKVTPTGLEEPYLDLLAHSDQNLAIAYDSQTVLVGGSSAVSIGIVHWLADLFATGEACFLSGHRFIAFCDARAARELVEAGTIPEQMPSGYAALRFASRFEPLRDAA